jgi:hypothetical protein
MDYMKVRDEQQAAAQQWEGMLFRTEGHKVKLPVLPNPEDTIGPNERILKRSVLLLSYYHRMLLEVWWYRWCWLYHCTTVIGR